MSAETKPKIRIPRDWICGDCKRRLTTREYMRASATQHGQKGCPKCGSLNFQPWKPRPTGGARPGAGRKPNPNKAERHKLCIVLSGPAKAKLDAIEPGRKSWFIEYLIMEAPSPCHICWQRPCICIGTVFGAVSDGGVRRMDGKVWIRKDGVWQIKKESQDAQPD